MLKKSNDLRTSVTVCDLCSEKAVVISADGAFCYNHITQKTASAQEVPLKSAAVKLADMHSAAPKR